MPLYRFHRMAGAPDGDVEGIECEDAEAARLQAIIFAGETLKDRPELVWCGQSLLIDVVDDGGTTIYTLVVTPIEKRAPAPPAKAFGAVDGDLAGSGR